METKNQTPLKRKNGKLKTIENNGLVLLIDDESVIRRIVSEMLDVMGYNCITAKNGEEGIQLFNENKNEIILVILDIEMPGLSGDKVFDLIKKTNPHLKILLISGYSKVYLEAKYFKRKIESSIFLSKPFQLKQLTNKIESILSDNNC